MTSSAGSIDGATHAPWLGATAITAVYGAIVLWTAAHHEPWRDEVVPLSIARHAHSLAELAEPLKSEGHPILWYLVLWSIYGLVGQTWVLKAASIASAVGAIFLFNRSPLPWWLRWTFTFSFFPLYQYSVVSRGYCLVMLLLFAFCFLYPRRNERPLALGLLLAALANTEAFGFIMAVAAAAMWFLEDVTRARGDRSAAVDRRRLVGAAAVLLGGLACAAVVAFPDAGHRGTAVRQLDLRRIAAGVGMALAHPIAHSVRMVVLPMPSLWVWGYFLYLTRRPPVLCFAAISLVGIEVLFNLAHGPGAPWHIGNAVLVIVAAAWLDAAGSPPSSGLPRSMQQGRAWLGRLLAVGLTIVFADHVLLAIDYVRADVRYEHSANRRLADLLASDPALAGAVVLGEPDTPLWSLPYYSDNRIYLAREGTFRAWGIFAPPRAVTYDLAALLGTARRIREECGCPVVITLGWKIADADSFTNFAGSRFDERFIVTPQARADFVAATRPLARLRGPTMTDENYDVYVLR